MQTTSAIVDHETELAIQQSLVQITQDWTTILIAHRLSTVKQADQIFMLKHGQIVEQGTHQPCSNKTASMPISGSAKPASSLLRCKLPGSRSAWVAYASWQRKASIQSHVPRNPIDAFFRKRLGSASLPAHLAPALIQRIDWRTPCAQPTQAMSKPPCSAA